MGLLFLERCCVKHQISRKETTILWLQKWVRQLLLVIAKSESSFSSRNKILIPTLHILNVHTFRIGEIWGYPVFSMKIDTTKKVIFLRFFFFFVCFLVFCIFVRKCQISKIGPYLRATIGQNKYISSDTSI